jgi:hypothetical protein
MHIKEPLLSHGLQIDPPIPRLHARAAMVGQAIRLGEPQTALDISKSRFPTFYFTLSRSGHKRSTLHYDYCPVFMSLMESSLPCPISNIGECFICLPYWQIVLATTLWVVTASKKFGN